MVPTTIADQYVAVTHDNAEEGEDRFTSAEDFEFGEPATAVEVVTLIVVWVISLAAGVAIATAIFFLFS